MLAAHTLGTSDQMVSEQYMNGWFLGHPHALFWRVASIILLNENQLSLASPFQKTKTHAYGKGGVPQQILQRQRAMLREMKRLELQHFRLRITGSEDRAETVDEDLAETMDLQISLCKPKTYVV